MGFTLENTDGLTVAQLAALNEEMLRQMRELAPNCEWGSWDYMQVAQTVSERVLYRYGAAQ